jgi:energy-coupling factor transporter ATP-binding protein EcfA2
VRSLVQRVRITGFTIQGVGPLGRVFVRAADEMLVLYGLNGAGKSALIRAIVGALAGTASGAHVHIAVDRPFDRGEPGSLADDLVRALLRSGSELMDAEVEADDFAWDPADFGLPADASRNYVRPGDYLMDENNLGAAVEAALTKRLPDESPLAALPREAAAQGLFTLVPSGDSSEPRWRLFISVIEDEAAPTLRQHLESYRARWVEWQEDGADEQRALEILTDLVNSDPFMPMGFDRDLQFNVDRPSWAPYSLQFFGDLQAEPGLLPPGLVREGLDTDEVTLAYLTSPRDAPAGLVAAMDGDSVLLHPHVEERLYDICNRSNQILQQLVFDAPVLDLSISHPNEWLNRTSPIRWGALDLPSLEHVTLDALSDFQRRWSSFAIGLAAQADALNSNLRDVFLIVDEPERAAHPRALSFLAQGLAELGENIGAQVIVASHAADFLAPGVARLMHVHRDANGRGVADPLDSLLASDLEDVQRRLGIAPAELLQLIKVFLIVEGQHEIAVLEEVIGDSLHADRVHMMPMRGTHNLLTFLDAQFLATFTDAVFVIALDRTSTSRARSALDRLRHAVSLPTSDPSRHRLVNQALAPLERGTDEEQKLAELIRAAAKNGDLDRMRVHGFSKPDIIEYLPVAEFMPEAQTWREAKKRWPRGTDFKEWLRSQGAKLSVRSLSAIAARVDYVPKEFSDLLETCRHAAMRPHSSDA